MIPPVDRNREPLPTLTFSQVKDLADRTVKVILGAVKKAADNTTKVSENVKQTVSAMKKKKETYSNIESTNINKLSEPKTLDEILGKLYLIMKDENKQLVSDYAEQIKTEKHADKLENKRNKEIIHALLVKPRVTKPQQEFTNTQTKQPTATTPVGIKPPAPTPSAPVPKPSAPTPKPPAPAPKPQAPAQTAPKPQTPTPKKQPPPKVNEGPSVPGKIAEKSVEGAKSVITNPAVVGAAVGAAVGATLYNADAVKAASISIFGETGAKNQKEALAKVGQIVPNDPKAGVFSYGLFGMNSQKGGTIFQFVKENPQFGFKSIPGTKEFDDEWRKIAKEKPQELYDAQLNWYIKNVYNPLSNELSKSIPTQLASDGRVVGYMADRRIQMGTVFEKKALESASNATSAEDFIRKISEFDRQNIENAFPTAIKTQLEQRGETGKQRFIEGLKARVDKRQNLALSMNTVNTDTKTGNKINDMSIDNAEMKKLMRQQAIIVNNNNIVVNQSTSPNISGGRQTDKLPLKEANR